MAPGSTHLAEPPEPSHEHADGHPRFLAHHFGSPQQQFDAGKFGMWLFLITEVLFFSGLFCAYAVYRSTHPAAFAHADQYLDATLGATNTAVLILSSLTMAWAVRAAQLGQQALLVRLLTITLACANVFLGVKAVEYSHKWDMGILWASQFHPTDHAAQSPALLVLSIPAMVATLAAALAFLLARSRNLTRRARFWKLLLLVCVAYFGGVGIGLGVPRIEQAVTGVDPHASASAAHAADETHGASDTHTVSAQGASPASGPPSVPDHQSPSHSETTARTTEGPAPVADVTYTAIFFSIYYVMTGLHAIHILAGMGVMVWLLWRSLRGDFGPDYFGPVDYVGLYWHLVDLIWIYLFPLLYLIG